MSKFSIVYEHTDRRNEAIDMYEKAKKLLEKNYPQETSELAEIYTKLGK